MSSTKNNNQHEHMQQQHNQEQQHTHTQEQQHTQDSKAFAKSYLETPLANQMDETNKKAMNVWKEGGANAAVKYMMDSAGGDYSRMRSMFG
tara:strand:+ start:917 stop:1189 length:273 start_codon:yes stop_codon:yes gene_type:complete